MSDGGSIPAMNFSELFPELGLPPDKLENGSPNPDFYRRQLDLLNLKMLEGMAPGSKMPSGYEQAHKGILAAARLAGLSESDLSERRKPEDRIEAAALKLIQMPEADFELGLEVVEKMEALFDQIDEHCKRIIEQRIKDGRRRGRGKDGEGGVGNPPPMPKLAGHELSEAEAKRGKAWRGRFRRVRRLHERAKNAWTRGQNKTHVWLEAAHPVRHMLWTGRSQIADKRAGRPADALFMIGEHHAMMAVGLWEAEFGIDYSVGGLIREAIPYEGCMLVCPPRHTKTEFGAHWIGLRISQNPFEQCKLGHAVEDQASKNLEYVKSCFDPEYDNGRRNLALFPSLKLSDEKNNSTSMKLDLPGGALREPTMTAHGTSAAISGSSATKIWLDDPVDQKEADQEAERNRKFERINGTWLTRKTGTKAFDLTTTTLWHEDDANVRRIKLAAEGKLMIRVVILPAGGPDTDPPFKPVFPELYDSRYLRAKFNAMRNPQLYACAYQCNPSSKHVRKIQRLRFYDPKSTEHVMFLSGAVLHLSVDPAGTNRQTSDPAGLVYMGQGMVRTQERRHGVMVTKMYPELRILDALEVPSTQYEISKYMVEYSKRFPVDRFHVETRSGYTATAEMLENFLGISELVRHDPGNQQKSVRLQSAAGLIDDAISDNGGPMAVVVFPGLAMPDGTVGPDPNLEWLYEQFIKFGYVKNDHCVDAVTQVVNYLAPELGAGRPGRVSQQLAEQEEKYVDPDVVKEINRIVSGPHEDEARSEERDYATVCY